MPSNLNADIPLKFDDCSSCKFSRRRRLCAGCDSGEFFEELDPAGVDALFEY